MTHFDLTNSVKNIIFIKTKKQKGLNFVDITKPINTISFFKGYGGIERGIELTGERIRPIASCEIEAYAIANLVAKMEEGALDPHPIWTNAKTFPGEQFLGKVDLFTGGFPCQPFSAAGNRNADEDPRHLWPACIRAIESFRPHRVFFENVEGLISAKLGGEGWSDPKGTPVLLHVCRELERRGYKATWGVFSASEAGAPHQRKRVFILGQLANSKTMQRNGSEDNTRELIKPRSISESRNNGRERSFQWPTRPGEPQGRMEEPRVKLKSKSNEEMLSWQALELNADWVESLMGLEKHSTLIPTLVDGGINAIRCETTRKILRPLWQEAGAQALWEENGRLPEIQEAEILRLSLYGISQDDFRAIKGNYTKESFKNKDDILRNMSSYRESAKTSSELLKTFGSASFMSDLSQECTPFRQLMGRIKEFRIESLSDLRETIHKESWAVREGFYPKENLLKGVRAETEAQVRVDRLRLLGNGVVPQTAAIAWTVLNERLQNER